jgi:putative DNA primase/helicase
MSTQLGTLQSGALNGASPPYDAWDRPLPPDESADEHARAVLQLYHDAAAGLDGVLAMVVIDKRSKVLVQRFAIGDVAGMAAEAVARGNHANVYFGVAVLRKDLAPGERGTAKDIVAVLGLVVDDDRDNGRPAVLPSGMGASVEITTSTDPTVNRHIHYVFTRPLAPAEAKSLAELLHRKCGGDHGTKDIAHVWRLPQTLNHPNATKIARLRPVEPQPVEHTGGTLEPVHPEDFRRALEAMPDIRPQARKAAGVNGAGSGGSTDRGEIMTRLPGWVVDLVETEPEVGQRSEHCFRTMMALLECGLTAREVQLVAESAAFAAKYAVRGDLEAEIGRARAKWSARARDRSSSPDPALPDTEGERGGATDCDLADLMAKRHSGDLRYVAAWSKWCRYDGKVWKTEATNLARNLAKALCHKAASGRTDAEARRIASAKTVAGVQTLAASDRRIAATVDQWDADPWLLNTPAGVVDLRTGDMRAHRPDDHMSKIAAAGPGGSCPQWLSFLNRTFGGDEQLVAYMRRVAGYGLTGLTQEQAMFFGHGTGGNGKSVLLDTLAGIVGDYHTTAPIETFTMAAGDRHPTELAMLRGARLVTAIETEEGRRWAESRIKSLTGGDRIAARFMRQDFFEFKPQFKLFIAGNHKPSLRTVDEAIRRRFNLIPFAVTIPAEERDPALSKKLQAEWGGILQWMIDGCLEWQQQGLCPPKAVTDATSDYLTDEDAIAAWLEECCEVNANASDSPARIYESWKAYADRSGELAGSLKAFGPKLEARGFAPPKRSNGKRTYRGLRVKPPEPDQPHC